MTLATRPPRPQPVDPGRLPHLSGLFAPITTEIDVPDLKVDGEIPADIDGQYLRNGPNPRFTPLGGYLYPLDGDGMVHRLQIQDGKARYTNRFVRTPALVAEEAAGQALWPGLAGFGYTPGAHLVGPLLAHTHKDLPGINIIRHAGRVLALAESNNPYLLSEDLQTLGRETFDGALPVGITAHPKIDPVTGEMVVFCYSLTAPYLTWSIIGRDGRPVRAQTPVEGVDRPVMIHDMALTATYVVLILGPLFFDIAAAVKTGSPLSWEPHHGTRIALIPRDGGPVKWIHTDPFWLWHTANAHDTAGTSPTGRPGVELDLVEWSSPGSFAPGHPAGALVRLSLNPATGAARRTVLSDRNMEFPRIDDRSIAGSHRIIGTSLKTGSKDLPAGDADSLGWYDHHTGDFTHWNAGPLAVGEQTYIPRPGDPGPTSGWWITLATDRTDHTSGLLILAAADPTSGPIATIHLPQRVPLGLHGAWLPTPE